MPASTYRQRQAYSIESDHLRVTVTAEGGHIAEILDKQTGVNPLWTPPWPSIEPSAYDPARHPEYGADAESKLLAGILGHNLCLDLFGGPSEAEAAAGITVHGESSVAPYRISGSDTELTARADLPLAHLRFERSIRLESRVLHIAETVENLDAADRPIAWTQHVTLGPPFVEKGSTQFRAPATRSKTIEHDFSGGKGYMPIGVEFDWPEVPCLDGGTKDLRVMTGLPVSAAFSTHLMDPARAEAFFLAFSPRHRLLLGYVWNQADFPWLGIWEENHSRLSPPWNGQTFTRGLEFGVSPMPECRRKMIDRGSLFGVPGYRWIPARQKVSVAYRAFLLAADAIPESPPA
ncbi:MAG: hypothetical protein HYR60_24620 [Acidobacteria bacterium]|nr:hypothetical protein [Acidobacteriota bacterium]